VHAGSLTSKGFLPSTAGWPVGRESNNCMGEMIQVGRYESSTSKDDLRG
jgi:hypothetical protein